MHSNGTRVHSLLVRSFIHPSIRSASCRGKTTTAYTRTYMCVWLKVLTSKLARLFILAFGKNAISTQCKYNTYFINKWFTFLAPFVYFLCSSQPNTPPEQRTKSHITCVCVGIQQFLCMMIFQRKTTYSHQVMKNTRQ